jgi:hypothetical protein
MIAESWVTCWPRYCCTFSQSCDNLDFYFQIYVNFRWHNWQPCTAESNRRNRSLQIALDRRWARRRRSRTSGSIVGLAINWCSRPRKDALVQQRWPTRNQRLRHRRCALTYENTNRKPSWDITANATGHGAAVEDLALNLALTSVAQLLWGGVYQCFTILKVDDAKVSTGWHMEVEIASAWMRM